MESPKISIVMGSDSDLPIMLEAFDMLDAFKLPYEKQILSAHRTPEATKNYAEGAKDRGIKIIIAAAGGAAHLAGVIAALTSLPVIGVPVYTKSLGGLDSLLSTVQMPGGIPVATTGINGAQNAALLAVKILALENKMLVTQLEAHRKKMNETVLEKNERLMNRDPRGYIKEFLA